MGDPFDPTDENQLTADNISGYMACMIRIYQSRGHRDDNLWEIFHEDFEGFTTEIFAKAHRQAVRDLRSYLYNHGVWVKGVKGTSYAKVLKACLEEDPHEWTELEIEERTKAQIRNQNASQQPVTQPLPQPQPSQTTSRTQTPQPYEHERTPILDRGDRGNTPTKQLTGLMKIYNDNDKKYGGELYDILGVKLQVFYDLQQGRITRGSIPKRFFSHAQRSCRYLLL
jgi:hypothetical protein